VEAPESVKLVGTDRIRNVCPKVYMTEIQVLLDKEANLANRRELVHKQIVVLRGTEPPQCWGNDDCSTNILSQCPWRIDCDGYEAINWQETHPW
jgi:hypothetical protein